MNPLFQQMNKMNPMMTKLKSIAQTMRGDPQALLNSNPQAQQLIAQYGSPQKAFYAVAQNMGLDPNEVMRMIGM